MADEAGSSSAGAITSRKPSTRDYDVFLNFFGPDTRSTVVDFIYDAFLRAGVRVFYDGESTRQGTILPEEVVEAITNSSIYIPIFSEDYASSTWCLRELEKIMECWEASQKEEEEEIKSILPIFYDVDVSTDLKLKSEVYTTALQKHKDKLGEDVVKPWVVALQKAAEITGWDMRDFGLTKLTELTVEEVCCKLWTRSEPKKMRDDFVGIDDPMEEIMEKLDLMIDDVRFVAIHGIAGVGKTTLARLVFNEISSEFLQGVVFLSDISEKSRTAGIVNLQKDLLSQLGRVEFSSLRDADDGVKMIKHRLKDKKLLIVLDDLDNSDQLFKLAGELSWFGMGSRIITTTRKIEIMPDQKGYHRYEMKEMKHDDALKLFSRRVFESDSPPEGYDKISSKAVDTIGQLPLTINAVAPLFRDKYARGRGGTLKKLKKAVPKDEVESSSAEAATSRRPSSRDYEVFLSYRGPDSRYTVVSVLYDALDRAGIRVFYDDESIRQGEVIEGELKEAIINSKIYIPIFSKDYASSRWCLRELEKVMECWKAPQKQEEKKTILPIFYDVEVGDLRLKSKVYTSALQKHKEELGEDVVKPWEIALQKVATIKGCNIRDYGLHGLVEHVVKVVLHKLWTTSDPEKFVVSDSPSEEYDKISREVMDTTEQLPQTVNVLAPSFRDKYTWGGTHEKHKKSVHKDELESSSAETTTSRRPSRGYFEVFLNFQGPDCRHTIADFLYRALVQAGIRVFIDDEEIRKGEVIAGELEEAIINSKIYIPIFSKNYASSKWCLRELELIMKCWEASQEQKEKKTILPIFYHGDVGTDVILKSELYTTALQKHKDMLGEALVKPWEIALQKVARIKGWKIRDHGLGKLAELIMKEVWHKLGTGSDLEKVLDDYVGMDNPMEQVMKLIDLDARDVRFLTIHGIGGVGKTTLARLVFQKISSYFPEGVAFLSVTDVCEKFGTANFVNLQKYLISQLLQVNSSGFTDPDQGVSWIKDRLRYKRVLIVLDDLFRREMLSKLVGETSWFGMGTRIIVTTRHSEIMPEGEGFYQYKMPEMKLEDALKLFSIRVFNSDSPPEEYRDISRTVVSTTRRIPLVITTIAPVFSNIILDVGEDALNKKVPKEVREKLIIDAWEGALRQVVHTDVRHTMMTSYERLRKNEKEIFLDIACLFIDKEMEDAAYYWETRQLYPKSGIMILKNMSFIEIVNGYHLQMYDEYRFLGRYHAHEETNIVERRSRLWSPEEALSVVCSEKGTEKVSALKLGKPDADCYFNYKQFAGLTNLMFLELNGGNFKKEDFNKVFSKLRWLSWDKCPDNFEATNLCFENLIVLMLSENLIADDWGGWHEIQEAKKLKVLKCINCHRLTKSPDFSAFRQLERLVIKFCGMLRDIDGSIGLLEHLTYLEFTSLFKLETLPDSIGGLKSLSVLKLIHVNLLKLPDSIGELQSLKYLCLRCPTLKELPESVGKLKSLVQLDISLTAITKLPESVSNLNGLKLRCEDCPLKVVPDNIKRLNPSPEFDPSSIEGTDVSKDK